MTYVHRPYERLTIEQHNEMLKENLATLLNYVDGEVFKTIVLGQDNDYILQFIHDRKNEKGGRL